MPPAAPTRFVSSVSEDARKVKLSWEPGFGSTEDVVYQIIRKTGSAPQNNNDGMSLGEAIEATAFDDVTPPVAVRVFYGVSASRGGGSSPVSVAEVIALPPVTNVVVSSDPSSVSLRWTTRRGVDPAPARHAGRHDRTGVTHRVHLHVPHHDGVHR